LCIVYRKNRLRSAFPLRLIAFTVLIVIGLGSQWFWIDQFLVVSTTSTVGTFP
jgi:hypothetical protein